MTVLVVVPWRSDGDSARRVNLYAVSSHLVSVFDRVRVVSDGRASGPFCRSAAFNRGLAIPASAYVWHEADMIVPPAQLEAAVDMALASPGLVVPFTTRHELSDAQSELVRKGADPATVGEPEHSVDGGRSIGAVGVTSAETMRLVGGWDESFTGWGFDDNAMFRAFEVCAGPARWVEGPAWHLWHLPAMSADPEATAANQARFGLYLQAGTSDEVRRLTCGAPQ